MNADASLTPGVLVDEKGRGNREHVHRPEGNGGEDKINPSQGSETAYAGSPTPSTQTSVEHSSQQETALAQLVMEELSEESQLPNEQQSKAYDYKPSQPRLMRVPFRRLDNCEQVVGSS